MGAMQGGGHGGRGHLACHAYIALLPGEGTSHDEVAVSYLSRSAQIPPSPAKTSPAMQFVAFRL